MVYVKATKPWATIRFGFFFFDEAVSYSPCAQSAESFRAHRASGTRRARAAGSARSKTFHRLRIRIIRTTTEHP
ncbi:hypothetical protein Y032_0045g1278 [Ancylostoma ceylanicum]|uniref:Uncharacterized protein n=1 Tax=Ancylostoma ceylanicum TaxID=53326 RepID=A0A016UCU4_9BILA|nr:hypothetical protein Y032_0045g1278 [Ancylostoma ceylanicum]